MALEFIDLTGDTQRKRRDWHGWLLHGTRLAYPAYPNGSHYWFDLTSFGSSAAVLDIIIQVNRKGWATEQCVVGLVHALDDILDPQENLCSGRTDKRLTPSLGGVGCECATEPIFVDGSLLVLQLGFAPFFDWPLTTDTRLAALLNRASSAAGGWGMCRCASWRPVSEHRSLRDPGSVAPISGSKRRHPPLN